MFTLIDWIDNKKSMRSTYAEFQCTLRYHKFTSKPNSLIDYALCGTSFENIILTSFLSYAATDDDQTNPTKKLNAIQYFCKPQYPFMMYNNVYRCYPSRRV